MEREREREGRRSRDEILLSWSPGCHESPYLGHVESPLSVFHYPERGLTETPTTRSCSPLRRNKAAGVKQRTSHLHTFRT